jgi:hypothetical protein
MINMRMKKMKSKFDIVYNSIKRKISLIVEDFSVNENDNWNFQNDDDGNVICTFSIEQNNDSFTVVGKYYNDEISFILTDSSGSSTNYSEKEFATNYNKDYENYKDQLNSYLNSLKTSKNDREMGKIDSFSNAMDDEVNKDPDIKLVKSYEIEGTKFLFKLLNDIAVENYCECIFDFQDTTTNEIIYIRSLLNIMKKNSVIIKLLFFNDKGELTERLTKSEFLRKYPDIEEKLEKAINKFELYVEEMK